MKDLKDNLNEQLGQVAESRMKVTGPYMDEGDTQHISINANNRNVGLYTCYDSYIGTLDVIETKDIEAYMMNCGYDESVIDAVTGLKPGYSYSYDDEYIWTCLEECR